MNDTTRRFLNAVLERVTESRIVEVRLFPAIRQGGIESGIAVLAVEPEPEPPATISVEMTEPIDEVIEVEAVVTDEIEVTIEHPGDLDGEATTELHVDVEVLHRMSESHVAHEAAAIELDDAATDRETTLEVSTEGIADVEVPGASEESDSVVERTPAVLADDASGEGPVETVALGDILLLPSPEGYVVESNTPKRLAILCARYKLVFKGPERGKWDIEIMHQADAPLDTLDRVISGVVRRAGEESEPERFSRESLRTSLDAPAWAQSA